MLPGQGMPWPRHPPVSGLIRARTRRTHLHKRTGCMLAEQEEGCTEESVASPSSASVPPTCKRTRSPAAESGRAARTPPHCSLGCAQTVRLRAAACLWPPAWRAALASPCAAWGGVSTRLPIRVRCGRTSPTAAPRGDCGLVGKGRHCRNEPRHCAECHLRESQG